MQMPEPAERHKYHLIARMPNEPGALQRAAEIIKQQGGNINRIHYDQRIDPHTVFFEVTASAEKNQQIQRDLLRIGYLQTSVPQVSFLRLHVYLPHRPGALFEFLNHTTAAHANLAFLDFDERGPHPDRLTVSMQVEQSARITELLDTLKSRYQLEIVEYDSRGNELDETVFYLRFAQQLRALIGGGEDAFILRLLHDINHIVQELTNRGEAPKAVFQSILLTGESLRQHTGKHFYADVQRLALTERVELFCFQLPCGGNCFLLNTPHELVMVDTGFGIYHPDFISMLRSFGLGDLSKLKHIFVTHADADHIGAGGLFDAVSFLHPGTKAAIDQANRAYGSKAANCVLEEVYTRLINLFSRFTPPQQLELFPQTKVGARGIFTVLQRPHLGDMTFEVLESLGGHLQGQTFFCCPDYGILFTGDSLINFASLTDDRKRFATLAKHLMTSVNVDRSRARDEREGLMAIASEIEHCLICGGHGAVSVLNEMHELEVHGTVLRYRAEEAR
jgi:glyoxylase-like metal-dependent hydrolase (beta-lactamase superfamily II)